jgi:uncharacterized repeat protein (TIGR03847 family)
MSDSYELSDVDRLTVGTQGPTGQRVFYLQARAGAEVVTVKLEKQQVGALARYLGEVLADLPDVGALPGELELEEPIEPRFVVGILGVTYDDATDRVVLVAREASDEEEDPDASVLRVTATREQIAALAIRGTALVEAGRPPCPLCGYPLDPAGHVCPKTNGHRAPRL